MTLPSEALPEALVALLGSAKARQGLPSALFETQAVHLDVMEPTGIVFTGDWHLGAQGMAYDRFERDLGQLAYAKRLLKDQLHIIVMGDLIDGYLPVGTPRNPTQLLSPREQRKAAVEALKLLQPTLVLEGDHDSWHSKQDIEHDWLYDACALSGWKNSSARPRPAPTCASSSTAPGCAGRRWTTRCSTAPRGWARPRWRRSWRANWG